ncbi:hypothetical protein CFK37_03265 [Virgibacillus phasianinus]|uniref:CPBP family intramembrane metalloprotease n=1 Tax=Virgibacillus phasianinus TaxID=2017483 RepID=A0A220TZL3_9BACI|nr:hypothetical protein [Virgibacillus phasianinus]ASK61267.1 hypothetical protein CFK37_03265 [Virgibacillus phasianinus]
MLTVATFISNLVFHIGVALAIYIYATVAAILFSDRFLSDILEILPWDLTGYKHSFMKWTGYGSIPLFIPIIIQEIINFSLWTPF